MRHRPSGLTLVAAAVAALTTVPFLRAGWRLAHAGYFGGELADRTAEGIRVIGFTGSVLGVAGAAGAATLASVFLVLTLSVGVALRYEYARQTLTLVFVFFLLTGGPLVLAGLLDPVGAPRAWEGALTVAAEAAVLVALWLPRTQDEFEDAEWYRERRSSALEREVRRWRRALEGAVPEDFVDPV